MWESFPNLLGQGLNFFAFLLPVLLGRYSALAFLVVVSAFASVASVPGTLAFASIFPSLRTPNEVRLAIQTSLLWLVMICGLGMSAGLLLPVASSIQEIVCFGSGFCFMQGCYLIAITGEVRRGDYRRISFARFWNGFSNFVGTSLVVVASSSRTSLVFPAAGSFLASVIYLLFAERSRLDRIANVMWPLTVSESVGYIRKSARAAFSGLLASLAYQASAFAILSLGTLASPWSIVVRLVGGFATVSRTVVAPAYEISFSSALRNDDRSSAVRANRSALLAGLGLALAVSAGVVVALSLSATTRPLSSSSRVAVFVAAILMTLGTLGPAVIGSNLVMLGAQKAQLAWSLTKALFTLLVLVAVKGAEILVILATAETTFGVLYTVLVKNCLEKLPPLHNSQAQRPFAQPPCDTCMEPKNSAM